MELMKLLTAQEVCAYLHVDHETLRRWRRAGMGPAWIKSGKSIIYADYKLQEWLLANQFDPKDKPVKPRRRKRKRVVT